jgi:hypothetical protein
MGTKKVGGNLFSYFLVLGFAALFALSVFGCRKKSEGAKTETQEEKPCPVWFKDVDKDGYTDGATKVSCEQPTGYVSQALAGDCNDDDKNLNPNTVWFKDVDKDGYTDGVTKVSCVKPSDEYVLSASLLDCNDNDPNINPGKMEICDGLDNDCDGQTDEGFNVGQSCTVGLGECARTGQYVCKADGFGTECNAVAGAPSLEICDGKDNDCNGQIDENLTRACYTGPSGTQGVGECKAGIQICTNGVWGTCQGEVLPQSEICDGKDNNCNGQIDEGFNVGQSCTAGLGECARTGQYVCKADGSTTECNAVAGAPTTEICDGKDNDCDGERDEDNVCGHLGDVVWLEGATPQNHSVLVGNSTYNFSIYLSYNIATTSSAIIEYSLMTTGYSWLGSVTYGGVSGSGQVQLTLSGITIPPNVTILGRVRLLDLNWNQISPWWVAPTLSYVSSSTSSVFYVWIKDENPQRGVEFQEGQTVTITLNVEYNALSGGDLDIVALSVEGQEDYYLAWYSRSVSGQGLYQFTLTFNVPSCPDSIHLIARMWPPTFLPQEVAVYPVRLTGSCLRARPTWLYFEACEGEPPPSPKNVYITSTISPISASLTPSQSWITVNPSSGSTPFMSSIGVNTTGPSGGSYSGVVTVSSSNANNSKTIGVSLDIIPASGPTGVTASSMLNSIQISWNRISGVDGYYVHRAINSGGPYTRISGLIPYWWTSYLDSNVQCGVTYYYVVSATSSCGEFFSSEVSARVEPQPEICDGLDNDCDGQIDDGLTGCYSAIYNPDFGAPLCRSYDSPCSSGALLTGRDNTLFNPERNQPNTLDGCPDGTSYWWIESLEAVTLTSLDSSGNFVPGGEVKVEFVAWCGSTSDYLDVYYASGVTIGENPNWQYLSTYQCTSYWYLETFSHTFNLDNTSGYHAVRGVFRYQGSPTSCPTGFWDEADDIVFPVHD